MAKCIRLLAAGLVSLFLFSSCGGVAQSGAVVSGEGLQQAEPGGQTGSDGAEIALFITEGQKAQGLGQAVWNTVSRFSGEEGVTNGAYTVDAADVDATLATIDLAIKGSAKIIVAIGDEMIDVVERAQVLYPDLRFILMGAEDTPALHSNAVQLEYDELQAGWLAGYAAVLEGYRVLAFVESVPPQEGEGLDEADDEGGAASLAAEDAGPDATGEAADDSVTRQRNIGFVLGSEAAAADLGLEVDSVQVQTLQLDGSENATERREIIAGLYESGVELLFAGDGAAQNDALRVARSLNTAMIGVSLSFAYDDAAAVASVDRVPGQPLYSLLRAWKNGDFPTQRVYYCGLEQEGFTLESTGFARFTSSQYGTLVARFAGGSYAAALHQSATTEVGRLVNPLQLETQRVLLVQSQVDEGTGMFQPPAYYGRQEDEEDEADGVSTNGASKDSESDTSDDAAGAGEASSQPEEDGDEQPGSEAVPAESMPEESGEPDDTTTGSEDSGEPAPDDSRSEV